MRSDNNDPLREISFQPDSAYRVEYGTKRIGKPRQNWIHQTKKYIYVTKKSLFSYSEDRDEDDKIMKWAQDRDF